MVEKKETCVICPVTVYHVMMGVSEVQVQFGEFTHWYGIKLFDLQINLQSANWLRNGNMWLSLVRLMYTWAFDFKSFGFLVF